MPTDQTRPLRRHLLQVVLRPPDEATDRDLLAAFVADRDEEAFAELVRRHGSMVLGVCRRVTGNSHDAEDAFQAAFLVLARRAGQVGQPERLGNWLYGVAVRTALEARAARRRIKEQAVSAVPEPAAPTPPEDTTELRRVIDEELAQLPDKYRAAVVLCELEGLSRKDAAVRLKIPEGTLSSRLAHARRWLADRLTRRGLAAPAAGIAAVFTGEAGTALSPNLVQLTARAAARFAAGGVVPAVVSSQVATLTDGVLKIMFVNRLRLLTGAGVLVAGVLGLGTAATLAQFPASNGSPYGATYPAGQTPRAASNQPGAAKTAVKVDPKGIENDDVPYSMVPNQAVVRFEDGQLVVRARGRYYERVTKDVGGKDVTTSEPKIGVTGHKFDTADVHVFDMKGNRVPDKTWKEKLATDKLTVVTFDGRLPHPRELQLFKDDLLLIVFPSSPGITEWSNWGQSAPRYGQGGYSPFDAPAAPGQYGNTIPPPSGPPASSTLPPAGGTTPPPKKEDRPME